MAGYWPLDGDATDASGNGLDGEVLGNVAPTEDRFGTTDAVLSFPGAGNLYFDDIRLYRPRCIPDKVTLSAADLNSDCIVDFADLEIMADGWLAGAAGDLNTDGSVDFKDFAVLADKWLDERLWPEW